MLHKLQTAADTIIIGKEGLKQLNKAIKQKFKEMNKLKKNTWYYLQLSDNIEYFAFYKGKKNSKGFEIKNGKVEWIKDIFVSYKRCWKEINKFNDKALRLKTILLNEATVRYNMGDFVRLNKKDKPYQMKKEFRIPHYFKFNIVDTNISNEENYYPVFYNGKWAKVTENPLFKDKNGKYWYKSNFKKGEIYWCRNGYWKQGRIIRFESITTEMIHEKVLDIERKIFNEPTYNRINTTCFPYLRKATQEEIEWFERCKKANKFVEKSYVGSNPQTMYIESNDIFFGNKEYKIPFTLKIEKELPKSWEEYYNNTEDFFIISPFKEIYKTLDKLLQLRDKYRDGWKPNYDDNNQSKYLLRLFKNNWIKEEFYASNFTFTFQSEEIRDKFFENFKDLLEQVKPLFI